MRIRSSLVTSFVLSLALGACGGGSSATSSSSSPAPSGGASGPTTSAVEGVSTPSSVSVVTATNAQQ